MRKVDLMDSKTFDTILDNRLELSKSILGIKAKEYSSDKDRLHNFKRAAQVLGTTPEKALMGMFIKHFVSILDMVDFEGKVDDCLLEEKIGDAINYMILLEAILKERSLNNSNNLAELKPKPGIK
jgi:hypothetical protein